MTPAEIDMARNFRACGIPWTVISKELKRPVDEIRKALGLPKYDPPAARPALPWEVTHDLFAGQPAPGETSDR